MEVDRVSFPSQLLELLEAISTAHFVAIDFEFSGVVSNIKPNGRVKQTLQERYSEVKQAAERYQILQIGITCATEMVEGQNYELQTYNLNLSPILEEDLEVERIFSFQSSAAEFLLGVGFQMDLPFRLGVQYLSRKEEAAAKQKAVRRLDKSRFKDIQLTENDTEALAFLSKVRGEIEEWLKTHKPSHDQLSIISRTRHWSNSPADHELTGFDKRLIHQLVRAEYPGLVTRGFAKSLVITRFDAQKEKTDQYRLTQKFTNQINQHIGFRWVIEALCGGSIKDINLRSLAFNPTGQHTEFDFYESTRRHTGIVKWLEARRPVLVGHNIFTDLVYLYQCFIGDLPDTVSEFQDTIHDLFPLVVDTKYMATHNCGDIAPASSLEQIHDMFSSQLQPEISVDPRFSKYDRSEAFHEAGYDSLLTAQIMIRLSAKLSSGEKVPPSSSARGQAASNERSKKNKPMPMPDFNSLFWREYGNRPRVFGTFETFLELDPKRPVSSLPTQQTLPIRPADQIGK